MGAVVGVTPGEDGGGGEETGAVVAEARAAMDGLLVGGAGIAAGAGAAGCAGLSASSAWREMAGLVAGVVTCCGLGGGGVTATCAGGGGGEETGAVVAAECAAICGGAVGLGVGAAATRVG